MSKSFCVSALSIVLFLSLACSLSVQTLHADEQVAETAEQVQPLRSGQRAPAFVVEDVNGEELTFNPNALERPAVLITFRGGWCPYCNLHLSELQTVVPEIAAMGVDVMFLSGDRAESLYASLSAETQETIANLDYQIYSDADAQAAIALGLAFKVPAEARDWFAEKGTDIAGSSIVTHGVLAVPAVYAIDRDGMIRFDFVEPDYKVRLPADELLAAVQLIVE